MTTTAFLKRLPRWALTEAAERRGLDWGSIGFALLVSTVAAALMVAKGNTKIAYEDVAKWMLFTFPATVLVFGAYVTWVAISVSRHFFRDRVAFRFEMHERHNFAEKFTATFNGLPMAPDDNPQVPTA